MEEMERTIIEVEQREKSNTKRLDRLETITDAVWELATSVKLMAQNLERVNGEQEQQSKRLETLEKLPAERWNSMMRTILASAVSTLTGGLVGAMAALLIR
ncbi:MAG: hypothetical protein RR197_00455 [Oscillospiraceae bacterium]